MVKLGQHFLTDKHALEEIASLLAPVKTDFILEIGPGHGELTEKIAASGCAVAAIEKDGELADALAKKFSSNEKVKIIAGDALEVLADEKLWNSENKKWKLAGNIPYYITGKLLRTIGEMDKKPDVTVLTIQKEVAERLAAQPPRMNRLAASVQFWAEAEVAIVLPKNIFNPPPEVDSATVVLKTLPARKIKPEDYYRIVRAIFSQPRKTILNNVSDGLGIPKKEAAAKLAESGIQPELRPQNLSLEDIIKLSSVFTG